MTILVALVLLVIACGLGSANLTRTFRIGYDMNVDYPDDWWVDREDYMVIFSPEPNAYEYGDVWIPPILFAAEDLRFDYFDVDRYRSLEDVAEQILEALLDALYIGNSEERRVAGVDWVVVPFQGEASYTDERAEGWIAVCEEHNGVHFLMAAASRYDWEDYEDIFDAMLRSVRFD